MKWSKDSDFIGGLSLLVVVLIVGVAAGVGFSYIVIPNCPDADTVYVDPLEAAIYDYANHLADSIAASWDSSLVCTLWMVGTPSDTIHDPCSDSIAVLNERLARVRATWLRFSCDSENRIIDSLKQLLGSGTVSIAAVEKCLTYHIDWVPTYGSDTSGGMWCGPPYNPDTSASIDFDKWRDLKQARGL